MKTTISLKNVLKLLVGVFAIILLIPISAVLLVVIDIFAAAADEQIDFVNGRALSSVQSHIVTSDRTINHIVKSEYSHTRWSVHHADDELMQSYVRCEAVTTNGTPIAMKWFVKMNIGWDSGPRLKSELIGAINEDAARVAPNTVKTGHPIYKSADMAW